MVSAVHPEGWKRPPPQDIDAVVNSIVIPACPALLQQLQREMAAPDPDARVVARMVTEDVALSLTVLRTVNAPFYGLRRKVQSIVQAVALIGMRQLGTVVTSTLMREAIKLPGEGLAQFWEVANQRSFAMRSLAQRLQGVDVDAAQAFGLFCDIGMPLLMHRFEGYAHTLQLAVATTDQPFTQIESQRHGANHAQIGAVMARTWGLSDTLCTAIQRDHDFTVFSDATVPEAVAQLVAMSLFADMAITQLAPANGNQEWTKGGAEAQHFLMLSDYDLADWMETLKEGFFALDR